MSADMVAFSRLMEFDEESTIARQKAHRAELIDPTIELNHGRIVKTTGDGMLVDFESVVDAVNCAVEIQSAMAVRESATPDAARIRYRIGINLGDIINDGDDIFGDGVNIAARLETLAQPGGICISDVVYQSIEGKLDLAFDDLGAQSVKNIARPVHVWQWRNADDQSHDLATSGANQDIRFCMAPDGVQIAYATVGTGPPLVKAPNWMNHLEYDWQSPIWRHLLQELAREHMLIRFDQRGNGLSDWDVDEISFDSFVRDLETVVDAAGLERFPLLGISQGCAISVAYAVRHPERVSRLVLYGGYARGSRKRGSQVEIEQADAMLTLIRHGWGRDNPAFRQMFTSAFVPEATPQQMDWFNELQRISTSPENAVRNRKTNIDVDVEGLLGSIAVPTLVLHCRDDGVAPFKEGRRMAAMIPEARFVPLEGRNHLILDNEPAWPRFLQEVREFLGEDAPA
ncbi:MAG: alpha/beta fold hydrolase [Alphaproteobacteria bacterium]|nr:alpha/beta fold hydrolase [Alphaproteobacteria bacterium]